MGIMKVHLYTDAGSRGNPGPSAYAVIICSADGQLIHEHTRFIGICTNNEAEYKAMVAGLEEVRKVGADDVEITSDSELMVRQINGQYRMKAENLRPLLEQVLSLMAMFKSARVLHARREHPMIARADALLNQELDDMELARKLRK
jgi:ribonuclease HI